ncbi:MAG: polyphosphate polymerase domain-containing protein [Frankiaceae bacterium]|nr:polyphosphate polymerase domain-containing protein [Frankiaceae bacterium]
MTQAGVGARRAAAASPSASDRRHNLTPLHFRRLEMKYVIPERRVPQFLRLIRPHVKLDPFLANRGTTSYPVTSMYFDSYDLQSLFAKEAGWLSRRRIRLRTYAESFQPGATAFFEIKRRHDFLVSKDRLPLMLPADGEQWRRPVVLRQLLNATREKDPAAREEALVLDAWYNLQPTAIVAYDREAYVSRTDPEMRLTVDRALRGSWTSRSLQQRAPLRLCGIHPTLPRLMSYGSHSSQGPIPLRASEWVIIELKFATAIPRWLHQTIMTMNLERSAYSKYAFLVRALRPNLFEATEDDD